MGMSRFSGSPPSRPRNGNPEEFGAFAKIRSPPLSPRLAGRAMGNMSQLVGGTAISMYGASRSPRT